MSLLDGDSRVEAWWRVVTDSRAWSDFRRLWGAFGVSELGSAVGMGALPLIALTVLHVSAWQVTLMAALGGVAAAVVAVPLGPAIEFRRKRPVMVTADLVRFAVLASVPITAAAGVLSYALLCVAQMVATAGAIGFTAAATPNLKTLLPPADLLRANSRMESTAWTATTVGPPMGGVLISVVGATVTVAVDALSFLASALGVASLRTSEPSPPARPKKRRWWREVSHGWRTIAARPMLLRLFVNAMTFGFGLLMIGALMPVFLLRDLHLAPWQYGIALGLPSLGGVLGAALSPRLAHRLGTRPVLLGFGSIRTLWSGLLILAPAGWHGMVVTVTADSLLLFSAGVFNPVFTTYRMQATPTRSLARVVTAWSVTAKSLQALGMAVGGVIATHAGTRPALACGALAIALGSLALPWRATRWRDAARPFVDEPRTAALRQP